MLHQLFYREKGVFLQSLHPASSLAFLGVLLVLALVFDHPLYLLGIMAVLFLSAWAADGLAAWEGYLKAGLWMALFIMLVNPLLAQAGKTVLWQGPALPVAGRVTVTLEALCYGAAMGIRLLDVIGIFCLYNIIVHPDRLLNLFSRFAFRSGLVVTLSTRLFPVMAASLSNITEMQQLRGVDFKSGSLRKRALKKITLLNVMLVSSLEDSLQMAEAMQARAFGSGRRSCYRRELFRPRDGICLAGCALSLGLAAHSLFSGYAAYAYYPELGYLTGGKYALIMPAAVLCGLLWPAAMSWGWQHCPFLRSKI